MGIIKEMILNEVLPCLDARRNVVVDVINSPTKESLCYEGIPSKIEKWFAWPSVCEAKVRTIFIDTNNILHLKVHVRHF
ncbi:MAG: hypothetical protein J6K52_01835 [Clostridia bacterium]|nr:hypothetical protein [Clostridia bacterium]